MSEKQNRGRGRGRGRGRKASVDKTDAQKPAILQHHQTASTSTSTFQNENASISKTNKESVADAEDDVFLEKTTLSDCWVTPKTKGSKQRNTSSVSSTSGKKDYNRQCEEDLSKVNDASLFVDEGSTDDWNVVTSKSKQRNNRASSESKSFSDTRQRHRSSTASGSTPGWDRERYKSSDYSRNQTNPMNVKSNSMPSTPTTASQPNTLLANYFRLKTTTQWYQYRVEYTNASLTSAERRSLIYLNKKYYGGYLYDDKNDFLRVQKEIKETKIQTKDKNGIQIQMKFISMTMGAAEVIRVLNTIIRRCFFTLQFRLIGRNFFDEKASKRLNDDVSIWPGTITSIRYHKYDILLCVEPSYKFMRDSTIYDLLNGSTNAKHTFITEILGKIVYNAYSNKTYTVDDIDWDSTPNKTFTRRGEEISFINYYKERYNITIKHTNQPLLISNLNDRDKRSGITLNRILIPELCLCTGLTADMKNKPGLMQKFAEQTRMPPNQRIQKLLEFSKRVLSADAGVKDIKEWQLEFEEDLLRVPKICLPSPEVHLAGAQAKRLFGPDWSNALRSSKLYYKATSKNLIVITPTSLQTLAADFYILIENWSQSLGFTIKNKSVITFIGETNAQYVNAIEKAANSDPDMIIVFIPSNKSDIYAAVKKKLCIDRGILSQVILSDTIKDRDRGAYARKDNSKFLSKLNSIASKIVIQMNSKFGADPWSVVLPSGLLTIGYDVCHDTSNKSKSVAAIVSTMNGPKHTSYYSAVASHRNGEEMSNNLPNETSESVKKYREIYKTLPDTIMIYRDGVGEGQIGYVMEHEVMPIVRVLENMYGKGNAKPKFAFIIVTKRIRTRLFDGQSNPIPGTVVDDVITLPDRQEFYLISQTVRQGTVTPTNYNILHNTTGFDMAKIQEITYRMTHLYYNWTSTTRVPAVCQYAHKLAYLAGHTLHRSPHTVLSRYLYFL